MNRTNPNLLPARWRALSGAVALGLMTWSAAGQTNLFTDGNSADDLDAYPGAGGTNGWTTGWQSVLGASTSIDQASVINTSPLNGGGNYLTWRSGGNQSTALLRPYAADYLDVNWPYEVEFDYRCDVFTVNGVTNFNGFGNSSDYVGIQSGFAGSDQSKGSSFWVKAQGAANANQPGLAPKFWSFLDGGFTGTQESAGLFVNSTNVPFTTNVVYHFKFIVDPVSKTYEGSVTNLSSGVGFNTTAATGRKFKWKAVFPSTTDFYTGTNLMIIGRQRANETNTHSIDTIRVTQLPRDTWPVLFTQILPRPAHTFYQAVSNFSFTITTFGLTNSLPATNVALVLNGTLIPSSGLTFDGTDADTNRTVTFSGLVSNRSYTGQMIAADQEGRRFTNSFFFDTFVPGNVTVIETENWNFDPTAGACDATQDNVQPDRYIQNWLTGGNGTLGYTNLASSYYSRRGVTGIDFFTPTPTGSGTLWRVCDLGLPSTSAFRTRNETSVDFSRPEVVDIGLREVVMEGIGTNEWWNYTHEWPKGNYVAYLRGGVQITNYTFDLNLVNGYATASQTSNRLASFSAKVVDRREDLRNNPLVDDAGYSKILPLDGKTTLQLLVRAGHQISANASFLNYMVFVPVADIAITDMALSGANVSFRFNTEPNVHYTVQYKDNLDSPTWLALPGGVVGTGSPAVVTDPASGDGRFYRVVSP